MLFCFVLPYSSASESCINRVTRVSDFNKIKSIYELNACCLLTEKTDISIEKIINDDFNGILYNEITSLKPSKEKWLKLFIYNDFPISKNVYLHTKHNDYVSFYAVKNNTVLQHNKSGFLEKTSLVILKESNALNYISINPKDTITAYIHIRNFLPYHYTNHIEIFNEKQFHSIINKLHYQSKLSPTIHSIFFGSVVFALLFVLFLFYYIRSQLYLYYALYLFCIAIFALPSLKGFIAITDIFHLQSPFYFYLYETSLFLFSGVYGLFVLKILEINKHNYPKIYYFTTISSSIIIFYAVFLVFWIHFFQYPYRVYFNAISIIYVQISSFILLIAVFTIQSVYKRIVLVGMSAFFIFGMLAFVLDDILRIKLYLFGYVVNYFLFLKAGILIEILFFAMALGKRTYILEQERLNNYKNYINELEQKNILTQKVNDVKLEALRSQFQPHFVFNCLNSINYLILNNELDKASEYINKFSKLFRYTLEASRNANTPLKQELNTIKLYIDLERERLQQSFDFELQVDELINLDRILIPSLLLQPIVENSIWHGLQPSKRKDKKIIISVDASDTTLSIKIYDNGVGKLDVEEKKSNNKSLGMRINEEKIDIFNSTQKNKINIIHEYNPIEYNQIGTLVTININ